MASMAEEDRDLFDDDDEEDSSQFDSEDEYPHDEAVPPPSSSNSNPATSFISTPTLDLIPFSNPILGTNQTFNTPYSAPDLLYPTTSSDRKRNRTAPDESRRIFQKLWTDEDEISFLQGFLEFTTQRGTTHADYQYDTGPFFDQIRTRLKLDFNKNQLVEKLRRLKRKYRNAASRIAAGKESVFKSPHDRATFEISQNIWSSSFKRERKRRALRPATPQSVEVYTNGAMEVHLPQVKVDAAVGPVEVTVKESVIEHTPSSVATPIMSEVEETVKSYVSPLLKELVQCATRGNGGFFGSGLAFSPPLQLNMVGSGSALDERWKKQHILELEVFLKRMELMQDQIKAALEELRSKGVEQKSAGAD